MKLDSSKTLITGAAGGIGSATARQLGAAGARLLLTDVQSEPLSALARELEASGITVATAPADITRDSDRRMLTAVAAELGVNCLVNIAGINPFGLFDEQTDAQIEKAFAINATAPILLCRALLPVLERSGEAHIVNVGSVFGSLGYPGFAVYSATKFAVRGFTEALRREFADRSIRLHYVAPRATRTSLSTDRVCAMNRDLRVAMDDPETVAAAIETTLGRSRREVYLGRPERIFGLLNSLLPGLVDRALRKQLPVVLRYASVKWGKDSRPDIRSVNIETMGAQQ